MSELKKILAEPEDNRPIVEQAISLLSPDDQEAFTEALWSSQFPSSQLRVALASDGAVRDANKVPTVDAITKYRKARGIL